MRSFIVLAALMAAFVSSPAMAICTQTSPCAVKCKWDAACMAYWGKVNAKGKPYARAQEAAGLQFSTRTGKPFHGQ